MTEQEPLFIYLAKLAEKDGVTPLADKVKGCWERKIGEHWWIAVNGTEKQQKCSKGIQVPGFNCYVEFNGWPAGFFDPYGGVLASGEAANEETFVQAIEEELRK